MGGLSAPEGPVARRRPPSDDGAVAVPAFRRRGLAWAAPLCLAAGGLALALLLPASPVALTRDRGIRGPAIIVGASMTPARRRSCRWHRYHTDTAPAHDDDANRAAIAVPVAAGRHGRASEGVRLPRRAAPTAGARAHGWPSPRSAPPRRQSRPRQRPPLRATHADAPPAHVHAGPPNADGLPGGAFGELDGGRGRAPGVRAR